MHLTHQRALLEQGFPKIQPSHGDLCFHSRSPGQAAQGPVVPCRTPAGRQGFLPGLAAKDIPALSNSHVSPLSRAFGPPGTRMGAVLANRTSACCARHCRSSSGPSEMLCILLRLAACNIRTRREQSFRKEGPPLEDARPPLCPKGHDRLPLYSASQFAQVCRGEPRLPPLGASGSVVGALVVRTSMSRLDLWRPGETNNWVAAHPVSLAAPSTRSWS